MPVFSPNPLLIPSLPPTELYQVSSITCFPAEKQGLEIRFTSKFRIDGISHCWSFFFSFFFSGRFQGKGIHKASPVPRACLEFTKSSPRNVSVLLCPPSQKLTCCLSWKGKTRGLFPQTLTVSERPTNSTQFPPVLCQSREAAQWEQEEFRKQRTLGCVSGFWWAVFRAEICPGQQSQVLRRDRGGDPSQPSQNPTGYQ